jgi:hypothetical protein
MNKQIVQDYIYNLKERIQNYLDKNCSMDSLENLITELEKYTSSIQNETKSIPEDDDNVPRYIFFHETVINSYGLCPFIFDTLDKRLSWLFSQKDSGELYFSIKDFLFEKTALYVLLDTKRNLYKILQDFHESNLSPEQLSCLNECLQIFKSYFESVCKSKRTKLRFNIAINNVTKIVKESGLRIDVYLNALFDKKILNTIEVIIHNKKYYDIVKELESVNLQTRKLDNQIKKQIYYLKELELSSFNGGIGGSSLS